jgi:cell wall-associated NlpC family hydrolase
MSRIVVLAAVAVAGLLLVGLLTVPMMIVSGSSLLFAASGGCPSASSGSSLQPVVSTQGRATIPADYLALYQHVGHQLGVPWVILAGIGEVESDHGRANLPGVRSGDNGFGAAGPMQIGIGGAAGDTWGGAPVHPAGEKVAGVATDENGDGIASVYEPADAIAGAAKYLLAAQVLTDPAAAIFSYNHLESYVQSVLSWATTYAQDGFSATQLSTVSTGGATGCLTGASSATGVDAPVPNQTVATIIAYAEQQIGKPYLWGGTGPDAFDCSGLVMMAYRTAGIDIPRTSEDQWTWGPQIRAGQEIPGDLVFFAGSDGTTTSPGHVGLVIGHGMMVEAYSTGFPIRIAKYTDRSPVGFSRPWAHAGVVLPGQRAAA